MLATYARLDYYSAMFYFQSMDKILDYIGVDCNRFIDGIEKVYCTDRGYDVQFVFKFNNITFSISNTDVRREIGDCDVNEQVVNIFKITFPSIRLSISGQGLDWLRSQNFDVENRLRVPYPEGFNYFKLTRVDFAYDFINSAGRFYEEMYRYLTHCQFDLGLDMIPLYNSRSSTNFQVRAGTNKSIYIGSTQGDRLLRIYDKAYEMKDKRGNWREQPYFIKDSSELSDVHSWVRIEWQLRRDMAQSMLFGKSDGDFYLQVLKVLHDTYLMKDVDRSKRNHILPVTFWDDIFTWSDIEGHIIQNSSNITMKSVNDTIKSAVSSYRGVLLDFVSIFGFKALYSFIIDYAVYLATPLEDSEQDFIRLRRKRKHDIRMNEFIYDNPNNKLFLDIKDNKINLKEDLFN